MFFVYFVLCFSYDLFLFFRLFADRTSIMIRPFRSPPRGFTVRCTLAVKCPLKQAWRPLSGLIAQMKTAPRFLLPQGCHHVSFFYFVFNEPPSPCGPLRLRDRLILWRWYLWPPYHFRLSNHLLEAAAPIMFCT